MRLFIIALFQTSLVFWLMVTPVGLFLLEKGAWLFCLVIGVLAGALSYLLDAVFRRLWPVKSGRVVQTEGNERPLP